MADRANLRGVRTGVVGCNEVKMEKSQLGKHLIETPLAANQSHVRVLVQETRSTSIFRIIGLGTKADAPARSTRGWPVCRPASMSGISVELWNTSSAWRKTISPASGQADFPAAPREQRPAKRVDVLMVQLACPAKVQRDPQQIWPSACQGQSSWSGEGLGATTWRGFLLVPRAAELNLGGWVAGRSVEPGWTLPRLWERG